MGMAVKSFQAHMERLYKVTERSHATVKDIEVIFKNVDSHMLGVFNTLEA